MDWYGTAERTATRAMGSLLGLVIAVGPCEVVARTTSPAEPSGREIDPAVPGEVPWLSDPAPPPAPVIDPREAYIERRLREREREPMLEEEPEDEDEDDEERDEGGPPRGVSLIVPGAVLVGVGAMFTFLGFAVRSLSAGGFCIDNCEDNVSESPPAAGAVAFAFAGLSVAAGTGLLVVGGRRQAQWRAWKARQPPPPPPPASSGPSSPRRGIGMMLTGASLLGPGTIYSFVVFSSDGPVGRTLAGLSAAAGVTLLSLGAWRNVKYRRWRNSHTLVPTAGRTAHGTWVAGMALRF